MRELTPEEIEEVGRWPVISPRVGAQDRNDWLRKASPIDLAEDWPEKIARIESSLIGAAGRDRRLLLAELTRLKAEIGLLPLSGGE